MTRPFVQIAGLTKSFGAKHVLRGVDLSVSEGESSDPNAGLQLAYDADASDEEVLNQAKTSDEVGTKLDLARAYIEMGDEEGARDILEELMEEGSNDQQEEAQQLLSRMAS